MAVSKAQKTKAGGEAGAPGARLQPFVGPVHDRRLGEVCKLLPLTNRVLGRRFGEVFTRYAKEMKPAAKKHLGDALSFALFLERTARRERFEPRWVLDLMRYEKSRIKASDPRRRVVACLFRHDISRLVRSVARREVETVALRRLCAAVWMRRRRGEPVRYAVLSLPELRARRGAGKVIDKDGQDKN
ncbi:MAG TPA: hypothetical protein VER32_06120 [Pyrinomonadaceae bacterium]|nr:hypothetical protein [Pyrinomonadaceae bacterium]